MSVKEEKFDTRRKAILDKLRGNPCINQRLWESIEKEKKMARQTFFNTRNRLVNDGDIKREEIGRSVWLYLPEDYKLFKKKTDDLTVRTDIIIPLPYPSVREIDDLIIKLVNTLDGEPTIDEVAKELGEDPKDHDMRRIIAKRLKVISASIKSVEAIIQELYDFGKKSDDIKRTKGNEIVILAIHEPSEKGMPSDVEIIREVCKKNLDISLVIKIIPLCKKNFKKKNLFC